MAKTINKPRPYQEWEIDYIKENYRKQSAREVAEHLGRTESSILTKVCDLKIPSSRTWIKEDVEYLKDNFINKTDKEISEYLNKGLTSISSKRYSLGLIREKGKSVKQRPWTDDDIIKLKSLCDEGLGNVEIANILDRTRTSVATKKGKLKYSKSINEIHWSKEDDELLKIKYPDTDKEDLIKLFNRSWYSILGHAKVVGVVRSDKHKEEKVWTDKQLLFLENNWYNKSDIELSNELHKRPYFIRIMREECGFKREDAVLKENHIIDICNYDGIKYIRTFIKENKNTNVSSIEFNCEKHGIQSVYVGKFNKFGNNSNHICSKCSLQDRTKWDNDGILNFLNEKSIEFIKFDSENKLVNTAIITKCATCNKDIPITVSSLIINNKPKCSCCNGIEKRKITIDFIKDELKDTYLNLISTEYPRYDEDILYTCSKHLDKGIQKSSWANLKKNKRCKYCGVESSAELKRKEPSEFYEELYKISDGRIISLTDYEYSDKHIIAKCLIHNHEWEITPSNLLINPYCVKCTESMSKGENEVYKFLQDNLLDFTHQYKIIECRNIKPLPFDFAVFGKDGGVYALIEFMGRQHFKPVCFGGISKERALENFKGVQYRDNIKKEFCINNKIKLIYIRERNEIENILREELKELAIKEEI